MPDAEGSSLHIPLVPVKDEGILLQACMTLPTDFPWTQSKFQEANGIVLAADGLSEFLSQGWIETGGCIQQPPVSQVEL